MKTLLVGCVSFLVASSIMVFGQGRPGRPGSRTSGGGGIPNMSTPVAGSLPGISQTAFISGKVTIDDGTELTESASIQTICRGQRHTTTHTGRNGNFSFQFGDTTPVSDDLSDAGSVTTTRTSNLQDQRNWRDCELQAVLAGFTSEVIELSSRMNAMESTDLGRIVLHRLEHVEGTSISVTTALAPSGARKAMEKALEQEKKEKLDQAEESLQKAVRIYPKYAVAWFELGQVQMQKNRPESAKVSFERALAADPKYVNPYGTLALLAYQANQWQQVLEISDKLIALNPVNFPQAYFFSGVADYYLGNIEAGEKIVRRGIKVDDAHQVPKLQYLLGMILLSRGNYAEASEHMQEYIHYARQPGEIAEAQKQLDTIARLSASPNPATVSEKK